MEETQFHLELQRLNQRIHEMSLRQAQRSPPQQHLYPQQQQQQIPEQSLFGSDLRGSTSSNPLPPMTQPELPDPSNSGSDLFEAQLQGVKAHINGILGSLQSQQSQQRDEVEPTLQNATSQVDENSEQDIWKFVNQVSMTMTELQQRQDELEDRMNAIDSPTVLTPVTCSVASEGEQQDEVLEMDASSGFASQPPQESEPVSIRDESDQRERERSWHHRPSYQDAIRRLIQNNYGSEDSFDQQRTPLSRDWSYGPSGHPYGLSQTRALKDQVQQFLCLVGPKTGMAVTSEKDLTPSEQAAYFRKTRDYLIYCNREIEHLLNIIEFSHHCVSTGSDQAQRLMLMYAGTQSSSTKQARESAETARGGNAVDRLHVQGRYLEYLLYDLGEELRRRDEMLQEKDNVIDGWKHTEKSKRADLRKDFWKYRRDTTLELEEKNKEIASLKQQLKETEEKNAIIGIGLGITNNDHLHNANGWDSNTDLRPHAQVPEAITPTHPPTSDSWGINTKYRTILSDPFWQPQSSVFSHETKQTSETRPRDSNLSPLYKDEVPGWQKLQSRKTPLPKDIWGLKPRTRWTYDTKALAQDPSKDSSRGVNHRDQSDHKEQEGNVADKSRSEGITRPEADIHQTSFSNFSNGNYEYVKPGAERQLNTQPSGVQKPYNQKIFDALYNNTLQKHAVEPSTRSCGIVPDTSKPPLPAPTAAAWSDNSQSNTAAMKNAIAFARTPIEHEYGTSKPASAWNLPERRQTKSWAQWVRSQARLA